MRSLLATALAIAGFAALPAAAVPSTKLVVLIYSCSGDGASPKAVLRSASGSLVRLGLRRIGHSWQVETDVAPGYYSVTATSAQCDGQRSFGLLAGAERDVAIVEGGSAAALQDEGGIAGLMPVDGARVFVERTSDRDSGRWASLDGHAFYADGLTPGTYDVYLHFENCCGIAERVTVAAGRVANTHFSIAEYYAQTLASQIASPYLSSLAIDSAGDPWFAESVGLETRIGTIDQDGRLLERTIGNTDLGLTSVTPGSNGSIWFFDYKEQRVARLDASGRVFHYGVANRFLTEFRLAPDGSLWAADFDGGLVEHIDPNTARVHAYVLAHAGPGGENAQIAVSANGVLLHTSYGLGRVATIAPGGSVIDKKLSWNCGPHNPRPWGDGFLVSCWKGDAVALTSDYELREIVQLHVVPDRSPMRQPGTPCDGRVWFGSAPQRGFFGIDLQGHRYFLPYDGKAFDAVCSGSRLWLLEHPTSTTSVAVSIDNNGKVGRYDLPETAGNSTNLPGIDNLVPDAAGNVWFLARGRMAVYRLAPGGKLDRIPVAPKPARFPE